MTSRNTSNTSRNISITTSRKSSKKSFASHMETGPLMAIDKEVDNVEEIQGSPGEEEEHAHTHQNPEKEHGGHKYDDVS